ncbi:MAG: WD40 repeat domain-containing protein [Actinomycetota bacterium]|nr:WD40 repeat domain-containing protein [Actinomycetota bacterium]
MLDDRADLLSTVGRTLRLASPAVARDRSQLTAQLSGRLMESESPRLHELVDSAQRNMDGTWLRTRTPSLEPPWGPLRHSIRAHEDKIRALVVLADGHRAITGSMDCRLRLWDLASGRLLREHLLVGEQKTVWRGDDLSDRETRDQWEILAIARSPDGRHVALGCGDDNARLWDVEEWQEVGIFRGHRQPVWAVAVTPDGQSLVTGAADGTLGMWSLRTGEHIRWLEGHDEIVKAVAVSPDGCHIGSGSSDGTVRLWDTLTGSEVARLRAGGGVHAIAMTPDGRYVLCGSEDRTIRVWDIREILSRVARTGRMRHRAIRTLRGHTYPVNSLRIDPAGKYAYSGGADTVLKVWDLRTWSEVASLVGHGGRVLAVDVSLDGRTLISGDSVEYLRIWDSGAVLESPVQHGHAGPILALAATRDGKYAVSASDDRTVRVWDVERGLETACLTGHEEGVHAVAVLPDGRTAISGGRDGKLNVWSLTRKRRIRTWMIPSQTPDRESGIGSSKTAINVVHAIAVAPEGRYVATAQADSTIRLWEPLSRRPVWLWLLRGILRRQFEELRLNGDAGQAFAVAFTPDGEQVVGGFFDHTLKVWNLATAQEVMILSGHSDSVADVAVTPDDRLAVSSSWDGRLILWELASGHPVGILKDHEDLVYELAITPSGSRALSASTDGTAVLWNLESQAVEARFTGDTALTVCAALADEKTFVVGDQAGRMHFLQVEDGETEDSVAPSPRAASGTPGTTTRLADTSDATTRWRIGVAVHLALWAVVGVSLNYATVMLSDRLLRWIASGLPAVEAAPWAFFAASVAWLYPGFLLGSRYAAEQDWSMAGFWSAPLVGYALKWQAPFTAWPANFLVLWAVSLGVAQVSGAWMNSHVATVALVIYCVLTVAAVAALSRALTREWRSYDRPGVA